MYKYMSGGSCGYAFQRRAEISDGGGGRVFTLGGGRSEIAATRPRPAKVQGQKAKRIWAQIGTVLVCTD